VTFTLNRYNTNGNIVIPHRYSATFWFSEGLAAVSDVGFSDWKYIDTNGVVVIAGPFASAGCFSEGLAAVNKTGSTGYINKSGAFVIAPQFCSAFEFKNGLAEVAFANFVTMSNIEILVPRPAYISTNGAVIWQLKVR
jgi:hypothetical protein